MMARENGVREVIEVAPAMVTLTTVLGLIQTPPSRTAEVWPKSSSKRRDTGRLFAASGIRFQRFSDKA